MCLSFVGQLLFGILMVITFGLTIVSLFLPGMGKLQELAMNVSDDLKHFRIPTESLSPQTFCRILQPSDKIAQIDKINSSDFCKQWFHQLDDWEKILAILLCICVTVEIITIFWTLISFFGCCCRKLLLQFLPIFAIIVAAFLAATIYIFAANNPEVIRNVDLSNLNIQDIEAKMQNDIGRRFKYACGALALAIIDIFVGFLNLCLLKIFC